MQLLSVSFATSVSNDGFSFTHACNNGCSTGEKLSEWADDRNGESLWTTRVNVQPIAPSEFQLSYDNLEFTTIRIPENTFFFS